MSALKRTVTESKLLIVRALARTEVAGQFFSTSDGQRVCTDGYSEYKGRRDELTLLLVIDMTAVARLLIGMRERETGLSYADTLAELGQRIHGLFPEER